MADEAVRTKLLKQIVRVEDTFSLQRFNVLRAGGTADYFTEATTTVELAAAVKSAIDLEIPYLVIGEGESVLFSDGGFPGLVIHNQTSSFGVALDKSQIVVDSGMPLSRLVTLASSRGFGGLTHLFGEPGTVGGAIFANSGAGQPFLPSVRYLTMLMPPARIDKEATINRYKREWMERPDGLTRLQWLRTSKSFGEPQPVILTALLQLTSVRTDELRVRLQDRTAELRRNRPKGVAFGPVFETPADRPVEEMLKAVRGKLRVGGVFPDRKFPNFFRAKGSVQAKEIRELIELCQDAVEQAFDYRPVCRYEYQGVW